MGTRVSSSMADKYGDVAKLYRFGPRNELPDYNFLSDSLSEMSLCLVSIESKPTRLNSAVLFALESPAEE